MCERRIKDCQDLLSSGTEDYRRTEHMLFLPVFLCPCHVIKRVASHKPQTLLHRSFNVLGNPRDSFTPHHPYYSVGPAPVHFTYPKSFPYIWHCHAPRFFSTFLVFLIQLMLPSCLQSASKTITKLAFLLKAYSLSIYSLHY